jgi:hypothetical protein
VSCANELEVAAPKVGFALQREQPPPEAGQLRPLNIRSILRNATLGVLSPKTPSNALTPRRWHRSLMSPVCHGYNPARFSTAKVCKQVGVYTEFVMQTWCCKQAGQQQ